MTPEVRIIPHSSADYLQEVELRRRILRWPLGLDFSASELEAEKKETHIVAKLDGKVVGCLVMVPQNASVVRMRQVAVEPEVQGTGIGAEMVRLSESWAQERGFESIELHARDTAVEFYRRLGYEVYGDPFKEVKIPHRYMRKRLAKS